MSEQNERENETGEILRKIKETEIHLDQIRGCLVGGAIGDALGYPVEFWDEQKIIERYGDKGISEYSLDSKSGKALISDDTQMTLFTANGILVGDTRGQMRGIRSAPRYYVAASYQDWLQTQEISFEENKRLKADENQSASWLSDVRELYNKRAPGNTCLNALKVRRREKTYPLSYIKKPLNDSKGCGGIMRIAPLALAYPAKSIDILDMEGAEIAAITHGHSLGYMPAVVLTHIINRVVFSENRESLKSIILEAKQKTVELFSKDRHLKTLTDIIELAIELSENDDTDHNNIHHIGEGWVAEETLGIAIYCSLKYQNDFSAGVIASVNHRGDSDSTGAVTGNILGALLGFDNIDDKWKNDLELLDVLKEMSDDLCHGCQMNEYGSYNDPVWTQKYIYMHHKHAL